MAEAWAKDILDSAKYTIYSAGTKKHGMNEYAVKVMREVSIDMSGHYSKTTDELPDSKMDFVFTVCSDAHENCPLFPGGKTIHTGFDDPPRLTLGLTDEEEILSVYRRVRDEIKETVLNLESLIGITNE
jgi:arsenate reductase